jgi:hypothetical protein
MHATWTLQDFGGKQPSEIFREHFLTCFISDPIGVKLRHDIGIDNICWEADYPHSDSMWPNAPEQLHEVLTANSVPDDEINKMTHENAMRWYSFDPFAHVPREQATVGALRRASGDHDVSVRSRSHQIPCRETRRVPQEGRSGARRRAAEVRPAGGWLAADRPACARCGQGVGRARPAPQPRRSPARTKPVSYAMTTS